MSSETDEDSKILNELLSTKITRRKALSTAGKAAIGIGAVAVAAAAGIGGIELLRPSGGSSSNSGVFKIGFIHFGSSTDLSWDSMGHAGVVAANTAFGSKVQIQEVEFVDYTQDANVMEDFASRGYNMVWSHSGGYEADAIKAANKHPNILWVNSGSFGNNGNYPSNYLGVDWTSKGLTSTCYILGALGAKLTKTNKLGFICGEAFPTLITEANAYAAGAKSVNPNIGINAAAAGTWIDPSKGKELADSMSSGGVDVVLESADTTGNGVITASISDKFLVFHDYYPAQFLSPSTIVTGNLVDMGAIMKKVVGDALNGTFKGGMTWEPSFADAGNYISLQPFGSWDSQITSDQKALISDLTTKIKSGTVNVPLKADSLPA